MKLTYVYIMFSIVAIGSFYLGNNLSRSELNQEVNSLYQEEKNLEEKYKESQSIIGSLNSELEELNNENKQLESDIQEIQEAIEQHQQKVKIDLVAVEDLQHFLSIIRERDVDAMHELISETEFYGYYGDQVTAESIIESYQLSVDIDSIKIYFNEDQSDFNERKFNFILAGQNKVDGELVELKLGLSYDESGQVLYHANELYILPRALNYVHQYIKLLKQADAEALAEFFSTEGRYPGELAQETIDNYASEADISTLEVEYIRFDDEGMLFRIVGENSTFVHEIYAVQGDGLVGVKDELRPEFNF
jgi:hypothetical protein